MPKRTQRRTSDPTAHSSSHFFGWKPELPDFRDKHYGALKTEGPKRLPTRVDLREDFPTPYNQGKLFSCTANAIAAAYQYHRMLQKQESFIPSRLFIYYLSRVLGKKKKQAERSAAIDSGAYLRDGIKVVAKKGAPPEALWPYKVTRFSRKPPRDLFAVAKFFQALQYLRLDHTNIDELRKCLAEGFPFVFGFTVYSSIERAEATGEIPMPARGDDFKGGHAVLAVGYDHPAKKIIFRNSWGPTWGDKGYGYIPYAYVTNPDLADDFWTLRVVE